MQCGRTSSWLAVRFTVLFHVTFVTLAPLVCFLFACFWGCFCVLLFVFCFLGALDDFFLTSSSRDMTATVLSNAALEKKKAPVDMDRRVAVSIPGCLGNQPGIRVPGTDIAAHPWEFAEWSMTSAHSELLEQHRISGKTTEAAVSMNNRWRLLTSGRGLDSKWRIRAPGKIHVLGPRYQSLLKPRLRLAL